MLKFIKGCKTEGYPSSDSEYTFIGRSNVGKSSLINALYNTSIVYSGKTPGKTRMLNFFEDKQRTICDVPGYGFARRNDEELIEYGDIMENYFSNRDCIDKVIFILDVRREPNKDDLEMLKFLQDNSFNVVVVCNKIDKLSNNELFKQKRIVESKIHVNKIYYVSCLKKTGINELKEELNIK